MTHRESMASALRRCIGPNVIGAMVLVTCGSLPEILQDNPDDRSTSELRGAAAHEDPIVRLLDGPAGEVRRHSCNGSADEDGMCGPEIGSGRDDTCVGQVDEGSPPIAR